MIRYVETHYAVSERRACAVAMCSRSNYRYRSCRDPRTELRARIREVAHARVRYGLWASARCTRAGGLERESEAPIQAVPRGGIGTAQKAAEAPRVGSAPGGKDPAVTAERMLEH